MNTKFINLGGVLLGIVLLVIGMTGQVFGLSYNYDPNYPILAGAIVEDFESYPLGIITNGSFNGFKMFSSSVRVDNAYSGSFLTEGKYIQNKLNSSNIQGGFNIQFDEPVKAFSFSLGALDDLFTMFFYSGDYFQSGTLLGKIIDNKSSYYTVYIDPGEPPIKSISVAIAYNDWVMFDNFKIARANPPAPVPEPGTLLLLGIGAGALFVTRKFTR